METVLKTHTNNLLNLLILYRYMAAVEQTILSLKGAAHFQVSIKNSLFSGNHM